MLNIADVTKYKVKNGDTLESLAKSHGMTWKELAKFNFGTSSPDEVNKFLRSQVGCFKKTQDKRNYIFTNDDNPGIIYIPNNKKSRVYATDGSYTLTVEPFELKKFVLSKVSVYFRPLTDWEGEYGFDWLRLKDDVLYEEDEYEKLITGGFNGNPNSTGLTKTQAYTNLKKEYKLLKMDIKDEPEYFVPYLNLFPKDVEGLEDAPYEAELQIGITVEDEEPLAVEFEYDKNLFSLDMDVLTDIAVGDKRVSGDGTVTITCLQEFDSEEEIKVLAYPKTWNVGDPIPIAGKIVVGPNIDIKEVNFVLIRVKTKIDAVAKLGSFSEDEKNNLQNTLYQALIVGHLEDFERERDLLDQAIDYFFDEDVDLLDLTEDPNFRITASARGKFIDADFPLINEDFKGPNAKDAELFSYLRNAFFKGKGTEKYRDYFTVFALEERTYDGTIGQVESVGMVAQKNVALFASRDRTTLNHEVLHGLGLFHSHKDGKDNEFKPTRQYKYTYKNKTTNNVMGYKKNDSLTTWRWQWEIMRNSI